MLSLLEKNLAKNNIDGAIVIIEQLGAKKSVESLPVLIKILSETDDTVLRNAIALALSDIGDVSAVKPLIILIEDPKTNGKRGTLLYALQSFDCSQYIDLFIKLLLEDSFEASRESFILIEKNMNKLSEIEKQKYKEKIETAISNIEAKLNLLTDLFNTFK